MADDTLREPKLRVLRVCVLVCEAFGDSTDTGLEVSIHRDYNAAKRHLDEWCRDIWNAVQEDWDLGEIPDDNAVMYEKFHEAAQRYDGFEWDIHQGVPLDLALTIVPAEAVA